MTSPEINLTGQFYMKLRASHQPKLTYGHMFTMPASLIGHCRRSTCFLAFVVITAWVTLLYVVGLEIALVATSIDRTEEESLALERVARVRFGSGAAGQTRHPKRQLYP